MVRRQLLTGSPEFIASELYALADQLTPERPRRGAIDFPRSIADPAPLTISPPISRSPSQVLGWAGAKGRTKTPAPSGVRPAGTSGLP